ncbi:hypothetical protein JA33_266 [Dickeya phage vB_DsoM_JA33]|uniref:Uncharacterized protein n=3 Tax=Salmondvirus JA11 TaxID=2734141 RepID=A0A384ZWQ8_9CAUD|nr:hypothetical protein HOU32_gp265 [Dickeya phage vB_DsoM_JA11]AXG66671.1 hypothetical protein JA13_268 [Dickeya phage vB_DsoM_JA13]AXG67640.1 hypothetical protein JA33_266 [Dickeya phage vB_DsoM_JA33]AYD80070.1 hypothetical protein JA11_265 [Dickeya phage vB_DsoM_JA11]
MEWFLVAFGLRYPSAEYALNMSKACVQISPTSYVVKSKTGFADAVNKETARLSITHAIPDTLKKREAHLKQASDIRYPCMIFFSDDSMQIVNIDYDQSDAME